MCDLPANSNMTESLSFKNEFESGPQPYYILIIILLFFLSPRKI